MSQVNVGDFPIDPQVTSGTQLAEILNRWYNASNTQNSGATEPPVTYPGMFWYDTSVTPAVLKVRNAGNSGWVDFADSIALTPADITGLGTMATVNSPAPVANGGTGSTTAAGARTNLGLDAAYMKKTGDTATGPINATSFSLTNYNQAVWFNDANYIYHQMSQNWSWSWNRSNGNLQWYANGKNFIFEGGGSFISPMHVFAGPDQGVAMVNDGPNRYLRFTSDGWRLQWNNGTLIYYNSGSTLLFSVGTDGLVTAAGRYRAQATNQTAFNAEGYADWGGGLLGRSFLYVNPGWSDIYFQALHQQGSWAGVRLTANNNGYIDFVLSSNPVQIRNANIEGRANSAGYADNTGAMAGIASTGWIHNNNSAVKYIRNQGATNFIGFIDGYGEVNWPVGPSDERLKDNIAPTKQDSLALVEKLEFIEYKFKETNGFAIDDGHLHELGLRAQQAQTIDKELVSTLGTYLQLNPTEVALLALHSVKQLLQRVKALEAA